MLCVYLKSLIQEVSSILLLPLSDAAEPGLEFDAVPELSSRVG